MYTIIRNTAILLAMVSLVGLAGQPVLGQTKKQQKPQQVEAKKSSKTGFFIGGGAAYSRFDSDYKNNSGSGTEDEWDIGYKGFLGYQFNKYIAVEGHYAKLGKLDIQLGNGDTFVVHDTKYTANGTPAVSGDGSSIGHSGLISLPVNKTFSPYLRLGVHLWDYELVTPTYTRDFSGKNLTYGLGSQFNLGESLALRAEFEGYNFGNSDVFSLTSSVVLKF
jgi:OmpA-OmpF porin, OOP family